MSEPTIADWEARIKAEIPDIAPSAGHDLLEEVLGLLRVTRSQRDTAERMLSGKFKTEPDGFNPTLT